MPEEALVQLFKSAAEAVGTIVRTLGVVGTFSFLGILLYRGVMKGFEYDLKIRNKQ